MRNKEILIGQHWMKVDSYGVLRRYAVDSMIYPAYGSSTFASESERRLTLLVVFKENGNGFRSVRTADQVIADFLPGH